MVSPVCVSVYAIMLDTGGIEGAKMYERLLLGARLRSSHDSWRAWWHTLSRRAMLAFWGTRLLKKESFSGMRSKYERGKYGFLVQ